MNLNNLRLFLVLCLFTLCMANCVSDSYTYDTLISEGCTYINGSLRITDVTVTNLDALVDLTFVSGYITISRNLLLENVDGLSNVVGPALKLTVEDNPLLTNIDGLAGIIPIHLHIESNANLSSAQISTSEITDHVEIRENPLLLELSLPGFTYGRLTVAICDSLKSISIPLYESGRVEMFNLIALNETDFSSFTTSLDLLRFDEVAMMEIDFPILRTANDFSFTNNPNLLSVSVPALENISKSFDVGNNPKLENLYVPELVYSLSVDIYQCDSLKVVNLPQLVSSYSLAIGSGGNFTSFNLDSFTSSVIFQINGIVDTLILPKYTGESNLLFVLNVYVRVLDFPSLVSLDGEFYLVDLLEHEEFYVNTTLTAFDALTSVGTTFAIWGKSIYSIQTFSSLETVGSFQISFSRYLDRIDTFTSLREVSGFFLISENEQLTSISFPALETIGTSSFYPDNSLKIDQNAALLDISFPSLHSIQTLNVTLNPNLRNVDGLTDLVTVNQGITIDPLPPCLESTFNFFSDNFDYILDCEITFPTDDDESTGDDITGEDSTGDDITGEDSTGDEITGEDSTGDENTDENSGDQLISFLMILAFVLML